MKSKTKLGFIIAFLLGCFVTAALIKSQAATQGHDAEQIRSGTFTGDYIFTGGTVTADNLECVNCIDLTTETSGNYAGSNSEGGPATGVSCSSPCISEGEIVQNTLDDSEIQDNSLTAISLAADSVGASELIASYQSGSAYDGRFVNVAGDTMTGDLQWGTNGLLSTDQGASIELGGTGTPYIDLKNNNVDYDTRIQLTGDDSLRIVGGELYQGTGGNWKVPGCRVYDTDSYTGVNIDVRMCNKVSLAGPCKFTLLDSYDNHWAEGTYWGSGTSGWQSFFLDTENWDAPQAGFNTRWGNNGDTTSTIVAEVWDCELYDDYGSDTSVDYLRLKVEDGTGANHCYLVICSTTGNFPL